VYQDLGISRGMKYGIDHARDQGQEIVYRSLPKDLMDWVEGKVPGA